MGTAFVFVYVNIHLRPSCASCFAVLPTGGDACAEQRASGHARRCEHHQVRYSQAHCSLRRAELPSRLVVSLIAVARPSPSPSSQLS
eukprot:20294-Pleurochrysis_carterae.AAC.3